MEALIKQVSVQRMINCTMHAGSMVVSTLSFDCHLLFLGGEAPCLTVSVDVISILPCFNSNNIIHILVAEAYQKQLVTRLI